MKQRWIGLALSVALLAACEGGGGSTQSPSSPSSSLAEAHDRTPTPTPVQLGIFADVRGWIAYGNDEGIWAVDPAGGTPPDLVQLSEHPGEPVAWSADGSKLLISRKVPAPRATYQRGFGLDLFVLSADGTEMRLTKGREWGITGSISPDGSKVIYEVTTWPSEEASARGEEWRSGIYEVDADGGEPRLLLASGRQDYSDHHDFSDGTTFRTALFSPTFSPDGTKIAYIDGMGDWGNTIRVMNADGSGVRVLVDWSTLPPPPAKEFGEVYGSNLAWSPDGQRLTFNGDSGTWIVGVDGDGLTHLPVGDQDGFALPGEAVWVSGAGGPRQVSGSSSGLKGRSGSSTPMALDSPRWPPSDTTPCGPRMGTGSPTETGDRCTSWIRMVDPFGRSLASSQVAAQVAHST